MVTRDESYGRWTVIEDRVVGEKKILCRCACGTERRVTIGNLTSGATRSCGCLKREATSARHRTHGIGYSDYRYRVWRSIKKRCLAPTYTDYPHYGGRGITMHADWVRDFATFAAYVDAELGPRPDGGTLDRIDNDGNYEPGNLRWATRRQQALNRRNRRDDLPDSAWRDLTEAEVAAILVELARLPRRTMSDIAIQFGVAPAQVFRVNREA